MAKSRKLQSSRYKSFRLQKRIKTTKPSLPNLMVLCRQTWLTLRENKKYFLIFTAMYALVTGIFLQTSATGVGLQEAKELIGDSLGNGLVTNVTLYGGLVGASSQYSNPNAGVYQFIIILVFSLAAIYGLRHIYGKQARKLSVKESLYKGMTPIIPVILVLAVLALQLLPLTIGTTLYSTVVSSELAVTNVERILWLLFVVLLSLLSIYLVCSSIFALFIVTLPNMTPMKALKASRELVRHRRLAVVRKLLFLPVLLLVLLGIIVVPFIAFLPNAAQAVFFLGSSFGLPIALTYMYNLYRSLL